MDNGDDYINKKKSVGIHAPDGTMKSILFGVANYYE